MAEQTYKKGLISVIMPIYALQDGLVQMTMDAAKQLRTNSSENIELIIVNNGGMGEEKVKPLADKYINVGYNSGYGGAMNRGIMVASGEFYLFSNNDIEVVDNKWEKGMRDIFSKPNTGAVGISPGGGFAGYFWAIRREVYNLVGGFDEKNFPLGHAQDTDYLYRLISVGWDVKSFACDSVKHHPRRTYGQQQFKKKYEDHWNYRGQSFQRKWGKLPSGDWSALGAKHFQELCSRKKQR